MKHSALEVIACGLNQYQSKPGFRVFFHPHLRWGSIHSSGALAGDGTTWQVMGEDGCFEGSGSVPEIESDSDHSFHRHSIHYILHHSPTVKPCQTSLPAPRTLASSVRPVALQAHLGHPLAERPGASPREGILASRSIGKKGFPKKVSGREALQNDAKRCKTSSTPVQLHLISRSKTISTPELSPKDPAENAARQTGDQPGSGGKWSTTSETQHQPCVWWCWFKGAACAKGSSWETTLKNIEKWHPVFSDKAC